MDAVERRAEKRVHPPGDALLDFALWPADPFPPVRLPLSVLGPPAACRRSGQHLELSDIAAIGLGLRLSGPPDVLARLSGAPALFVYLKLRDYRSHPSTEVLSFFFLAQNVRADPLPGGLRFGLRLLRLGRGSSFEKALEFLDVSRFGARELTVWIDAVAREGQRQAEGLGPGLDLDGLLLEPELAASADAQREGD
ncbi:hypothetical protein DFW101_1502 [Solidesulfovibrio carbinoliphilus subsp. oakridgensis]|uniref:Uncharacterized protein n=1 Tax=Solidesulfovibrio carbinoliphilus subsp. oakridgensis TaxID=694327 RepID=G7Q4Q0_9BACT|nr:hypothetical protein [Solidesulfovibrio carbinoliphilus]EHJ47510.1 hypothetical protein DFW101_1502 [Solidesulfovibrio carbinoliphilus subsp. oakridgensis]